MKRAVHIPYSSVSLFHQYWSLRLLGAGFFTDGGNSPFNKRQVSLRFSRSQLAIFFSRSSTIYSPAHQSHYIRVISYQLPNWSHHTFINFAFKACTITAHLSSLLFLLHPFLLIFLSLYNYALLFCTTVPLSPSLCNLPCDITNNVYVDPIDIPGCTLSFYWNPG
ncbi:hypothetical protein BDR03DRAFT_973948 [Suillus americanus]|nr:hypothetical protein BDR03DRAFT_973948 [Suillus americanus]